MILLQTLKIGISISTSISAMLLVENERGTIRVKKYILYQVLPARRHDPEMGRVTCALKIISSLIKKKKKNWSPSLKFTNRIVLTQQQSWESTYLSWRRACKEVKSAIHLSCTRFHVVIRKRSIPCLRGTRSSSTSNGKWKFYPQRRTKEIGIWRHRAR